MTLRVWKRLESPPDVAHIMVRIIFILSGNRLFEMFCIPEVISKLLPSRRLINDGHGRTRSMLKKIEKTMM